MTFIRPEARAQLWNWRELIAALCLLLLGLRWALFGVGVWTITGWAVVAVSVLLAVVGAQRVRFRQGGGGPGVVQVVEGQISYFGPLTGGAVAVSELRSLTLDPTARPAHWMLEQPGQEVVAIPVNAAGSEALFDVFAALPGIKTERMLNELQSLRGEGTAHPVVIWQRREEAVERRWLH